MTPPYAIAACAPPVVASGVASALARAVADARAWSPARRDAADRWLGSSNGAIGQRPGWTAAQAAARIAVALAQPASDRDPGGFECADVTRTSAAAPA